MAVLIKVKIDDAEIIKALQRLLHATGDLSPAFKEIGEVLVESTKQRFESGTGPDGEKWPLNSVLSTLLYKDGDRPLINEGTLMEQIHYSLVGNNTLEIGSAMEYAAMQQFGGTKSEFPNLWGDIPARPFLGISNDDEAEILRIIEGFLRAAI